MNRNSVENAGNITSSKNTMHGWYERARAKTARTLRSLSPTYLKMTELKINAGNNLGLGKWGAHVDQLGPFHAEKMASRLRGYGFRKERLSGTWGAVQQHATPAPAG